MVKKKTYFVVDDDPLIGEVVAALLGGIEQPDVWKFGTPLISHPLLSK